MDYKILKKSELSAITGGRRVERIDVNGDGEWDIKIVYRNNGTVKIKSR